MRQSLHQARWAPGIGVPSWSSAISHFVCPPHMGDGLILARQYDKPTRREAVGTACKTGRYGGLLCAPRGLRSRIAPRREAVARMSASDMRDIAPAYRSAHAGYEAGPLANPSCRSKIR